MIDQPVTFGTWSPQNYDGKYRGAMTLKEALAKSINTVAAQLADQVAPEAVVQTAKRMGINSPLGANPSIALGTSEVTLLELTGAYAPFANGGFAVLPFVVQRVRTPDGTVLFERTGSGLGSVASIESVALMNDMLQATVEMGTATKAADRRLAGRRQDRNQPEFPRRLVHRLHGEPYRRRLGRQRFRRADQARCPGAACRRRSGRSS